MSAKLKETIDMDENQPICLACGSELRSFSILICAECLEDECDEFLKLAKAVEPEE